MFDMKAATERLLNGCIIRSKNGVNLYTPDGQGNYPALWTRDFAYMVENASDLLPNDDIKVAIEYLLNAADQNGWIPDRVLADGEARYTAGGGDFPALANLDNGCFLVLAADAFLKLLGEDEAVGLFLSWKDALVRGVTCLPTNDAGMMLNDTEPLHSPYGFTDTIAKGGALCFETLLLWNAETVLIRWLSKVGEDTDDFCNRVRDIETHFTATFMDESGMLLAATRQCRQIDVWASCFAISIGFPLTKTERDGIVAWLIAHYCDVVQNGQVRHLPKGEYWEKTFIPVEEGTYQNGAFWATATGWFADAVREYDEELALRTIRDALRFFETDGIFECVNDTYRKLDTYVVSAVNVYGACRRFGILDTTR